MTGLTISARAITEENRLGIGFEFNGLLLEVLGFTSIILQKVEKLDDLALSAGSGIVDS
jgi:hypothetical protein